MILKIKKPELLTAIFVLIVAVLLAGLIPYAYTTDLKGRGFIIGFPFQTAFLTFKDGSFYYNTDCLSFIINLFVWYIFLIILFYLHSRINKI
jgi:hypothetical protein